MIRCNFQGRYGNILLQNIGVSIISKKFDFRVHSYSNVSDFNKLGLSLNNGSKIINNTIKITDYELTSILEKDILHEGVLYDGTFQVKNFVLEYKNDILEHFDLKYQSVDDDQIFLHIRLDDAAHNNPGISYYKKALELANLSSGYISTDSAWHPMIHQLLIEYPGLKLYNGQPIDTIDFAKNFNNLILSKGTFSWWIGLLSKAKNIYYPIGDPAWYGDIFVYKDWKPIDIKKLI